MTIQTWS